MPSRSAPTATTCAPYAGSAHASSRACRLVPAPDTRTTSRAGVGVGTAALYGAPTATSHRRLRGVGLVPGGPPPPGGHDQAAEQAADAERGDRVHQHVEGERPDRRASGPGRRRRRRARPARRRARRRAPRRRSRARRPRPSAGSASGAARGRVGEGRHQGRHAPAPRRSRPASGPSTGSAASSGKSGSGPITTAAGETSVWAPTAKPGPSRKEPVKATAFGTTAVLSRATRVVSPALGVQLREHGGGARRGRPPARPGRPRRRRPGSVSRMRRAVAAAARSGGGQVRRPDRGAARADRDRRRRQGQAQQDRPQHDPRGTEGAVAAVPATSGGDGATARA